jgi:glycosyltransferase involved in cell wall biosynthesis
MSNYFISVICPMYNEENYIAQLIDDMVNQDYPKEMIEILLVDGGSTDKTVEIAKNKIKDFPYFRVSHNPWKHVSHALNCGIKEAKGEIIMRIDAHSSYPVFYISTLLKSLIEYNADNVGGTWTTKTLTDTPVTRAIIKILSSPFGVGNSFFRTGIKKPVEADTVPFGCYKKEVLLKLGGYHEKLNRNQDIELNKRLKSIGGKILLIPMENFYYYARETFMGFARNNYQNGLWNLLTVFITKNLKSLSLRHFIPLIFILSVILPLIGGFLFHWYFYFISIFSLVFYSLFVLYTALKLSDGTGGIINIIKGFFILHFSYGFGSLVGLLYFYKLFIPYKKLNGFFTE